MGKKRNRVQEDIREMVRRIVKQFDPDKIILFGSHARGDAGPESDVDLLVVMPIEGSKLEEMVEMRMAVRDIRTPKDILISTPESFAWRSKTIGTVEYPAAREGKVLYERKAARQLLPKSALPSARLLPFSAVQDPRWCAGPRVETCRWHVSDAPPGRLYIDIQRPSPF